MKNSKLMYPLAYGAQVMYQPPQGALLCWMPVTVFLAAAPPLFRSKSDAEDDPYVKAFVEHIEAQRPLDGCELHPIPVNGSGHDGRHRAWAALLAGVELVPVFVIPGTPDLRRLHTKYSQAF